MRNYLFVLIALLSLSANAQYTYVEPSLMVGPVNSNHIKVIFTAEGFTASQEAEFTSSAWAAYTALNVVAPFSNNQQQIGYYTHFIPSVEEGIGIYERQFLWITLPEINKNTVYNYKFNKDGTARLIGNEDSDRQDMETYFSQFDTTHDKIFVIVICNVDDYGGSGEFPNEAVQGLSGNRKTSIAVVPNLLEWDGYDDDLDGVGDYQTSQNRLNTFNFLVVHEFLHSFGNLDDEYVDAAYAAKFYPTTIPNKKNIKDNEKTGLFETDKFEHEGGRYLSTGKWRRESNGIMRGSPSASGSSPFKVNVYPMSMDGNTRSDVQNEIDGYLVSTNAQPVSMAEYGLTNMRSSCDMNVNKTRYVDWRGFPYAIYIIGDFVYTDSNLSTPFNGNNQWFNTSASVSVRIGFNGEIIGIYTCSSGGGGEIPQ